MSTFKKNPIAIAFVLFLVITVGGTATANVFNTDIEESELLPKECGLYGSWEYSAENAPELYSVGALSVFYENGKNNVFVQLDEKEIFGEKVTLNGDTISFEVKLKGVLFSATLTAKGEVLTGTYTSVDGTFQIKGARVKVA